MELNIPTTEESKYLVMVTFLSVIKPFSELRKRELEVYAELIKHWQEFRSLTDKQRNKLIFNYDMRLAIATKYDTTVDNIYNIISALKKKGLIDEDGLVSKYANFFKHDSKFVKINLVEK